MGTSNQKCNGVILTATRRGRGTLMLGFETDNPPTPDLVAHIIQVSLSPIFLLTALGTLLSVFSLRLARGADKVEAISQATKSAAAEEARVLSRQLVHFRHRSHALDVAIVLA